MLVNAELKFKQFIIISKNYDRLTYVLFIFTCCLRIINFRTCLYYDLYYKHDLYYSRSSKIIIIIIEKKHLIYIYVSFASILSTLEVSSFERLSLFPRVPYRGNLRHNCFLL